MTIFKLLLTLFPIFIFTYSFTNCSEKIPPHAYALIVDCGSGEFANRIASNFPEMTVIGIDKLPLKIDEAKKTYSRPNLRFITNLDSPLSTFSLIVFENFATPKEEVDRYCESARNSALICLSSIHPSSQEFSSLFSPITLSPLEFSILQEEHSLEHFPSTKQDWIRFWLAHYPFEKHIHLKERVRIATIEAEHSLPLSGAEYILTQRIYEKCLSK